MSDIKTALNTTHTVLANGTTIHVNDHVYLAPEHLGEPYYIGRVMEFCTSHKRKGLQARIAWFNRPKDVINRKSADPRLLVATMHSDINPVTSIRGKCTVTHKYYVSKMDEYRKNEDNFYYNQLYDRYIQRVYDVVPCEIVQNVPMDTLEALKQRYQFIVVEQGKAADLTGARRMCCVCQEWCQSSVSVKCAACQKSYHMSCLNPPLIRKPSKGFAWQCAFCTRQEALSLSAAAAAAAAAQAKEKSSESKPKQSTEQKSIKSNSKRSVRSTRSQVTTTHPTTTPTEKSITSSPPITILIPSPLSETSIKLKINQKKNGSPKGDQLKMTHMWPFRYFGVNTEIGDILDVDDRIYPRAKSRIGIKYQATVADWDITNNRSLSPTVSDTQSPKTMLKSKKGDRKKLNIQGSKSSQKRSAEASPSAEPIEMDTFEVSTETMIPMRGGDDTITCLYKPGILSDSSVDEYMEQVKTLQNIPLKPYSSDLMDRALFELELNSYNTDSALEAMRDLQASDFKHIVDWSQKEIDAFEQSIREHGHDLNFAKNSVQTKSMADIVRFFYQWKKTERYETVYSDWTKIYKPMKKFKKFPREKTEHLDLEDADVDKDLTSSEEESDPTIIPSSKRKYECMNCLTEESKIWRRSPSDFDRKRKIFYKVLCNDCGIYWLKYAQSKYISPETRINNNVLQSQNGNLTEDEKKRKRGPMDGIMKQLAKRMKENPVPIIHYDPTPCKICLQLGDSERLYTCHGCGMSAHNDCYGIKKDADKSTWICDPCDNKRHPVASYVHECVLCYKSPKEKCQPLKRTAGYNWAHVQCATFIPEVKFVNPQLLAPVEYIGCVHLARLEAECQLCHVKKGACVACSDCKKTVHVQCAVDHGFKLAFEIQPTHTHHSSKPTKYPVIAAGLFSSHSPAGLMVPQVWCPTHNLTSRKLIELDARTVNDTQESSLMTYVKKYKCIPKGTTPAMRRFKATSHHQDIRPTPHKMPSPREAALDAISSDAMLREPTTITKITLTTTPPPTLSRRSSSQPTGKRRVCSSEDCSAQYTPLWWNVDDSSDRKICHRCHEKQISSYSLTH